MPRSKKRKQVANEPGNEAEIQAPAIQKQEVISEQSGRLWFACSWLSNRGKTIAEPGKRIFLSKELSDHYLKTAPGSIEPVD